MASVRAVSAVMWRRCTRGDTQTVMHAVLKIQRLPGPPRRACFRWCVPLRGVLIRCDVCIVTKQIMNVCWIHIIPFQSTVDWSVSQGAQSYSTSPVCCWFTFLPRFDTQRLKCQTTRLFPVGCGILWKDRSAKKTGFVWVVSIFLVWKAM